MPDDPVRFAVIGCGNIARLQHIPNIAASDAAELTVCCDLDDAALAECRQRHGSGRTTHEWREAVAADDVEAVCLATTEKLRVEVVAAAAEAGKAVYCEKPLARTLEEMYRIGEVVDESGIPFCVGHNRRCAPAMREARAIFRAHMADPKPCPWRYDRLGPEGRPALAEDGTAAMSVRINDDWYSWKGWVFDSNQAPHGPMLFEMTHFTDLCNWLLDAVPAEVTALEAGMLNHGIVVRYGTGEVATLLMTGNGTFGYPKELYEVFGRGAAVVVDHMVELRTAGIEGAPSRRTYPLLGDRHPDVGAEGGLSGWLAKKRAACGACAAAGDPGLDAGPQPDKGHAHAIDAFAAEIRGRGPVVCDVHAAIAATRVAFAAVRSARTGRAVPLEEV